MSLFSREPNQPNLDYMGEVDVALHRRGHPWAFTLSFAVLVLFGAFFVWADIAQIDDVTHGSGKVAPIQGVRKVQSERGGNIVQIFVKENDSVDYNTDVAQIRNTDVLSGFQELQNKSVEAELALARLAAESGGTDLVFSQEIQEKYPHPVQAQMNLYQSRRLKFEGEEQQLLAQIEQRSREEEEARTREARFTEALALAQQEEAKFRGLVGSAVTKLDYNSKLLNLVSIEGDLATVTKTIQRTQAGVLAAQARMKTRKAEWLSSIATDSFKTRLELDATLERMKSWDDQVTRTNLRSPVRGTVKNVLLKEGSVAKPAEVILEIIPTESALEIVARFSPADRGFLYVGQKGMAKFSAYEFSIHGGLEAKVESISEDTILDKRGEPWYEVHLTTQRKTLLSQGKELPILPGMTATVDLLTDKRTVLSYIIGPILRARQNAMTEH